MRTLPHARHLWLWIVVLLAIAPPLHAAMMAGDTIPDPFSFTPKTGVSLNSLIISDPVTISGINAASTISISGGTYSINGAAFTTKSGKIYNANSVRVRVQSSTSNGVTTTATLTIGGVKGKFSVTTQNPADTTPDAFSFPAQTGVPLNSPMTSNPITVSGINAPSAISVSGGLYSINNGTFVATAGTVNNGDSVRVQVISSSSYSTASGVTLRIGGISGSFTVTTKADALSFLLPPASAGNPAFTSEHFSGSANCTMCHNGLTDQNGKDVSIETDWSSSMMANAARDPLWRAKVRSELNRTSGMANASMLEGVVNDKCTRCHAPMANTEASKNSENKKIIDGGFLDAGHSRHDEALNGVSCTLCHQVQNSPKLGTLDGFTGKYEIGEGKLIYGPYDNLFPNPMVMNTGFTPTYSPHVKEAKLCGSCHNLKTPFVDEHGNVLSTTPESEFPEQMPYSEWERSTFAQPEGKTCQQCHMSRADGVAISNRPMWLQKRNGFAIHEFVGANKLMLDIFNNNKTQLGVLSNNFAETIAKTETMLQSAATIETINPGLSNSTLDFTLRINSQTGHKLPSAYPSRRVILHVTVKDATGNVVFESGKVNPDGSVAGVDADTNRASYEPHHDLITQANQVQVYEAIMGDNRGDVTYTLLRGMTYLKDNRILPQGFNKAEAPDDIKVVGAALTDNNFIGGSDDVRYQIAGLAGTNYQITAELLHQPLAYSFAQDLFTDTSAEVRDFQTLFQNSNAKTTPITTHTFSVSR